MKYIVYGRFKGKRFKKLVEADSKKQAKLRAGFKVTGGGYEVNEFMNTRRIKVKSR